MSRPSTNLDIQRVMFVESLHNSLRKQATKALTEQKKFIVLAKSYIEDGLDEKECIELLMIDGLGRESAESYTTLVLTKESDVNEGLSDYSFRFEDENDRVLCSYDIGKTIKAANDEQALEEAEKTVEELTEEFGNVRILDVHKIE